MEIYIALQHTLSMGLSPLPDGAGIMKILNSKGSLVTTGSRAGKQLSQLGDHPYATAAAVGVAALAISALVNRRLAKDAERRNPPKGRFLEIDGVRLHYVERARASRSSCCTAMAA